MESFGINLGIEILIFDIDLLLYTLPLLSYTLISVYPFNLQGKTLIVGDNLENSI